MSKSISSTLKFILTYIGVVIITLPGTHLIAQENGFNGSRQVHKYSILNNEDSAVSKIFIPVTTGNAQVDLSFATNGYAQINQAAVEAEKLIAFYFKQEDLLSNIGEHFNGKVREKDAQWIKNVSSLKNKILDEKFKINIKQGTSSELNYQLSSLTYTSDKPYINILLNAEWLNYGMKTEAITNAILEETGKVIENVLHKDINAKHRHENGFAMYLMGIYFGG
jgi:hypothetical protein